MPPLAVIQLDCRFIVLVDLLVFKANLAVINNVY